MLIVRLAVLALLLSVSACLHPDDVDSARVVQAVGPPQCDLDDCGAGNSPVIDGVYFWHLNSDELPNDHGVSITSVEKNGIPMRLVAEGDRLRGLHPVTGLPLFDHTQLENTRIHVSVNKKPYVIKISYVSPSWAEDESFWIYPYGKIEAYDFTFTPVFEEGRERPLCSLAQEDDPDNSMIRAIVFSGDRYNPATKEITDAAPNSGWMNIACKDGAPYKMHLSGHTRVANHRLGITTSLAKRRAMLNAWTMNACSTGTAFTVAGTQITLTESQHLPGQWPAPFQNNPVTYESIWGPLGALCMNVHRLVEDPSYEKLESDMVTECGGALPPSCESIIGNDNWDDFERFGYVLTGNPW